MLSRAPVAFAASLALACGAGTGVALALPTAAPATTAAPVVTIGNFTFGPMTVTVPVGGQVTWINGDDVPHTVMAADKSFRSKPIDTDERFSFTFTKPGVYSYFCSLHPKMTGTVIVKRP
ncbi:MAG TPA: cupredoxin family copper-binding protein [Caulobacteraceae bacterium]